MAARFDPATASDDGAAPRSKTLESDQVAFGPAADASGDLGLVQAPDRRRRTWRRRPSIRTSIFRPSVRRSLETFR